MFVFCPSSALLFFLAASCGYVISSPGLIQMWGGGQFLQNVKYCNKSVIFLLLLLLLLMTGRENSSNSSGKLGRWCWIGARKRPTVCFSNTALEVFDTNITRQTNVLKSHLTNRVVLWQSLERFLRVCLLCCCNNEGLYRSTFWGLAVNPLLDNKLRVVFPLYTLIK